jgi:hypothetical protein
MKNERALERRGDREPLHQNRQKSQTKIEMEKERQENRSENLQSTI